MNRRMGTDEQNVVPFHDPLREKRTKSFFDIEHNIFELARSIDLALHVCVEEIDGGREAISKHGSPLQRILEDCQTLVEDLVEHCGGGGDDDDETAA
jgi:hypothetical protein